MTEGIIVSDLQTHYYEAVGVSLYEPFVTIAVGETPYEAVSRLVDNSGFNPAVGYLVSKVMSHNHKVCVIVSGTFRRLFTVGQNVYTDNLNNLKSYLNADGSFDEKKFCAAHSVTVETETVAVGLDGQQMSMPRGMAGSVCHVDELPYEATLLNLSEAINLVSAGYTVYIRTEHEPMMNSLIGELGSEVHNLCVYRDNGSIHIGYVENDVFVSFHSPDILGNLCLFFIRFAEMKMWTVGKGVNTVESFSSKTGE